MVLNQPGRDPNMGSKKPESGARMGDAMMIHDVCESHPLCAGSVAIVAQELCHCLNLLFVFVPFLTEPTKHNKAAGIVTHVTGKIWSETPADLIHHHLPTNTLNQLLLSIQIHCNCQGNFPRCSGASIRNMCTSCSTSSCAS